MLRRLTIPLACALMLAHTALAQIATESSRSVALSLSYGMFQYDLSGTGDVGMIAVRVERMFAANGLLEAGIAAARPAQQFGDTTTYVIPEVQAQVQLPLGRVAPYLGGGVGVALDFRDEIHGGTQADVTVSAAAGLRAWITERLGARAELRVRGIGRSFAGSAAEWTIGAALRL